MKTLLAAAAVLITLPLAAQADTFVDPLHFTCSTCLADNGTFTPAPFGFQNVSVTASPAQSGTSFLIKELIPNNLPTFTATATGTVGATPFSVALTQAAGVFTTGSLETFLGITSFANGSPPNPIGAFLPSSQAIDPGATGFFVLTGLINMAIPTLPTPGGVSPLNFSVDNSCAGCWLMGDLFTGPNQTLDVTTAQSAALLQVPGPALGAGIPGLIVGALGLLGFARRRRNKRT
jgi:hypothetical protein